TNTSIFTLSLHDAFRSPIVTGASALNVLICCKGNEKGWDEKTWVSVFPQCVTCRLLYGFRQALILRSLQVCIFLEEAPNGKGASDRKSTRLNSSHQIIS